MSIHSDTAERIGRAIDVALAEQRRKRAWLSKETGISTPYINEICKGHKAASLEKLEAIADALRMTFSELARRAENLPQLWEDPR